MRGNVGRHTDRNAQCSVQKQIRNRRWQYHRLFSCIFIIWTEINGVLINITDHFTGNARHFRFGVAFGRGIVPVNGTEVSLPDNERIPVREILRHLHHRVVDGNISVRVIITRHISGDFGGFSRLRAGMQPYFIHRKKNPSVHRLQAVANIRQSPHRDDGHRIIKIRLFHLRRYVS